MSTTLHTAAVSRAHALMADDESDGHWVTINGEHVFIGEGGTIEKGPKDLVGKKPSEVGGKHAVENKDGSMSPDEAQRHWDGQNVPAGWHIHGRANSDKLRDDQVIQATEDVTTARQYAGKSGSVHYIKPKDSAAVLDASDGAKLDKITEALKEDHENGTLTPHLDDLIQSAGGAEKFREGWNPSKIVSSAENYDDRDLSAWLYDRFGYDAVKTNDGLVVLNKAEVHHVKVPNHKSEASMGLSADPSPNQTMSTTLHTATVSRAHAAIKAGKINRGKWTAPPESKRKQDECIGSGLSYPIFDGDEVSAEGVASALAYARTNAPKLVGALEGLDNAIKAKSGKATISAAADEDGHWVTIDGEHVFIKGGVVAKGPANLEGKSIDDHTVHHSRPLSELSNKPTHQMTRAEYIGSRTHPDNPDFARVQNTPGEVKRLGDVHRAEVESALSKEHLAGHANVPDHVLEDYPDLKAKARPEVASEPAQESPKLEDAEVGKPATYNGRKEIEVRHPMTGHKVVVEQETKGGNTYRVSSKGYKLQPGNSIPQYGETTHYSGLSKADAIRAAKIHVTTGGSVTVRPRISASSEPSAYALELQADGGGKAVPLALEGAPTVDDAGQPIHYRRALIAKCRDWTHRGSGEPFTITRQRADEWIRNTAALAAAGVKPFVPGQHRDSFNAADNFGYVERIERDGDDVYAIVALHGDDALKLAAKNGRSIYVVKDAIDASGKVYPGESLHHLALVPNPALPNLGGTLKIAACADGGTVRDVPVFVLSAGPSTAAPRRKGSLMTPEIAKQAREKLGLGADIPDDQLDDAVAKKALALSADVTRLTTERDAKAQEVIALSADKHEPDALSLSLITKAFKNEEAEVIRSGVISQAGVDELRKVYFDGGKPSREALALSAGSTEPRYSRVLDIIKRFPGLKSNADRGTPAEPNVALSADGKQEKEKPLTDEEKQKLINGNRGVHSTHVI